MLHEPGLPGCALEGGLLDDGHRPGWLGGEGTPISWEVLPIIPVVVKGKRRTVVRTLVDSGATISLFYMSIAENAGIDLEDAR